MLLMTKPEACYCRECGKDMCPLNVAPGKPAVPSTRNCTRCRTRKNAGRKRHDVIKSN